jgi:hypothetical protein
MNKVYTLFIVILSLALSIALSKLNYNSVNASTFLTNLITVSGITTAIIIAYAVNKMFQERAKRLDRELEIEELFNKITSFRKVAYYIAESNSLWDNYEDIRTFKNDENEFSYEDIHNHQDDNNLILDFWAGNLPYNTSTIDFYLALQEIIGDPKQDGWKFNPVYKSEYTLTEIEKLYDPSNQLWYYLFHKNNTETIHNGSVNKLFEPYFSKELKSIDAKYASINDIPTLIAKLGSDFYTKYLPKVYGLMKKNLEPLPTHFQLLISILLIIIIFGIILPLGYFWSGNSIVSDFILILSTGFSITSLISLFFVLKIFIQREVRFNKYTS